MVEVGIKKAKDGFWITLNGMSIGYITPSGKTLHISEAWCRVNGIKRLEVSHNHKIRYRNWNVDKTFFD